MQVVATLFWTEDNKYKLISSWNDELAVGDIDKICRALEAEDVKAKEREKNKKSENKK